MAQIIWSNRAKISLKKVYEFYASKSIVSAKKITNGIIDKAEKLQINVLFQKEHNLPNEFRRAIFKHYKIIYKVTDNFIYILQIFDTRQNPNKMDV